MYILLNIITIFCGRCFTNPGLLALYRKISNRKNAWKYFNPRGSNFHRLISCSTGVHNMKKNTNTQKVVLPTNLGKKSISDNWVNFLRGKNPNTNIVLKVAEKDEKKKPNISRTFKNNTRVLALDCEMVSDVNDDDMLARVSIVDYNLNCIYDKYVKPVAPVGDYRTKVSGIRQENLENAIEYSIVQKEVRALLRSKLLVGHSLHNDFRVLKFGHHWKLVRDTAQYKPFREISDGRSPALKKLAKHFLEEDIQEGEHDSIEDARTAMKLYKKCRHDWEKNLINIKKSK